MTESLYPKHASAPLSELMEQLPGARRQSLLEEVVGNLELLELRSTAVYCPATGTEQELQVVVQRGKQ